MTKPVSIADEPVFDLATADREMRSEPAYERDGHTARTLVREPHLRIVLVVIKAGGKVAEHRTQETASIHSLTGHVRLRLQDRDIDLPAGRLLVLERDVPHAVEALAESRYLLTLAWSEHR